MSEEIRKSTAIAEVVPVILQPHCNADTLSVIDVFGGYTVIGRTADWSSRSKGVYIPPDSIVDTTRPEFSFLAQEGKPSKVRIKARRLRGIWSMGLLIPAPEESVIGQDLTDYFGVEHYEPEIHGECRTSGNTVSPPATFSFVSKYDVDTARKYHYLINHLEPVMITEKINGANSRCVFSDGKMYCGSRNEWKEDDGNVFWKALDNTPSLREFCEKNPDVLVYGETYGSVQKGFPYGLKPGKVGFMAFDVMTKYGKFLDAKESRQLLKNNSVPVVPLIAEMNFEWDKIQELAEGKSLLDNHVREGVVVKLMTERYDRRLGRIILKVVGNGYLEKS